jgi:protein subunit release factor A
MPNVRVRLISEGRVAGFFIADICAMLEAVASRFGDGIDVSENWTSRDDALTDRNAALVAQPSAALRHEFGVHRAQFVPPNTPAGRVDTIKVGVELLGVAEEPLNNSARGRIVRTYNYPLPRCTDHDTGKVKPLDDVLAGAG